MKKNMRSVNVNKKTAAKLLLVCRAMDKEVHGLGGKKVNLLDVVRFGIEGMTLKEIYKKLGV